MARRPLRRPARPLPHARRERERGRTPPRRRRPQHRPLVRVRRGDRAPPSPVHARRHGARAARGRESLELALSLDPDLEREKAALIGERSAGVPFWIETLVHSGEAVADTSRLLTGRLRGVGPDPPALLALLAVAARPLYLEDLADLQGWSPDRAAAAVDNLVSRGVALSHQRCDTGRARSPARDRLLSAPGPNSAAAPPSSRRMARAGRRPGRVRPSGGACTPRRRRRRANRARGEARVVTAASSAGTRRPSGAGCRRRRRRRFDIGRTDAADCSRRPGFRARRPPAGVGAMDRDRLVLIRPQQTLRGPAGSFEGCLSSRLGIRRSSARIG